MEAFWDQLRPEDRAALSKVGYPRNFAAGADLYVQDRRSDTIMILIEIWAKVVRRTGDGEIRLAERRPGDILGEMSLVDGKPHAATVVSISAGRVLMVPHDAFNSLARQNDRLRRALLRVVVQRLRDADLVRGLGEESPRTRLVRLLLDQRRAAKLHYQREIAELLGISRASVVRELSRFRKDGLIETQRGRIVVLDPARLSRLLPEEGGR